MKVSILNILFSVMFAICVLTGLYFIAFEYSVQLYHRYTVGVTTGRIPSRSGMKVGYAYKVAGETYEDVTWGTTDKHQQPDNHYIVRYFPPFPRFSYIDLSAAVDTTGLIVPADGWNQIPANAVYSSQLRIVK